MVFTYFFDLVFYICPNYSVPRTIFVFNFFLGPEGLLFNVGPEQYYNINFLRYTARTGTITIKRHDTYIRAWLKSARVGSRDIWISLLIIWYRLVRFAQN